MLITIYDPTILISVSSGGTAGTVVPVFNDSSINALINDYTITTFEQAYPYSRYPYLQSVYRIVSNAAGIGAALNTAFPEKFPYYELEYPSLLISSPYTPNDFSSLLVSCPTCNWQDYDWYLDFIQARQAWGEPYPGSKGDSNTIIGVTDNGFFMDDATYEGNPDLISKVAMLESNAFPAADEPEHGTLVAGLVAGATDNGIGFPSIGFNCRLDLSSDKTNSGMLFLSGVRHRRILNGSWRELIMTENLDLLNEFYSQGIYNEVYENGTIACFAAGNRDSNKNWWYVYPASLNHNISVTGAMGENCYWVDTAGSGYQCLEHNIGHGDTTNTFHHNDRVDICAPGVRVGGLYFDASKAVGNSERYYTHDAGWGTSFSCPLVAGTLGLVESVKPCLSPYQQEVILKRSSRDIYTGIADNAYLWNIDKWHSRAGAGALDADQAVIMAYDFPCNDPATQTMFIEGIKLNTICAPGYASNSIKPKFTPIVINGTPPYTYSWKAIPGNTAILDSNDIATPTVISATGTQLAYFRLTVYDASDIQKVADRIVRVKLSTDSTHYDLAMRDSYMDMLSEPDSMSWVDPRDWNIWLSPDIWNRKVNDSSRTPENVEYFTSGSPNYMYVRVRNIGCADYNPSDSAKLHVYWTLGSTGENWSSDWTTVNVAGDSGTVPGGREITTNYGNTPIVIPQMHPGDTMVWSLPWNPIDPTTLQGHPTNVEVCGLARIVQPYKLYGGMHTVEGTYIKPNIWNNNNIVTRNMTEINLGHRTVPSIIYRLYVANPATFAQTFNLQLLSDKIIQPHFAGDLSAYMDVKLKMSNTLYGAWIAGGSKGAMYTLNPDSSITIDPSTAARLDSITLPPNAKYYVDLNFELKGGIAVDIPVSNQKMHFRQLIVSGGTEQVYGDMSYSINIEEDSTESGERMANNKNVISPVNQPTAIHGFIAYPVPASSTINFKYDPQPTICIKIFDITGRLITEKTLGQNSIFTSFDVSNYPSGVYWYQATAGDKREIGKIIIRNNK